MLTDLKSSQHSGGEGEGLGVQSQTKLYETGGQKDDGSAVQSTEDHPHQVAYNDLSLQLQGDPTPLVSSSTAVTYI